MKHRALTVSSFTAQITFGIVVLALLIAVSPGIGSQPIGVVSAWRSLWDHEPSQTYSIAFQIRLPRTIRALLAGASLSLTGAVFQTVFRNVLATPYTLGIASGGSLGALLAWKLGILGTFLGLSGTSWCAFAGCGIVVGLVFALSRVCRLSGTSLVLAGVIISLFCSAAMMFVTYLADVRETFFVVRWMMGNLDESGYGQLGRVLPLILLSWVVLLCFGGALNQLALGEELAASRGVRPAAVQSICIIFGSLSTACIVSLCGPIGFVGLIVPHAARLIIGHDHRVLLPSVALWGAAFLIVCDWLTRLVPRWYGVLVSGEFTAAALPIGVMTAVIGAPAFVVLLLRRRLL
jgi:iron complex transport system permease protein